MRHYNHLGRYACNGAVACKKENMYRDWDLVNCKNCLRKKPGRIERDKQFARIYLLASYLILSALFYKACSKDIPGQLIAFIIIGAMTYGVSEFIKKLV